MSEITDPIQSPITIHRLQYISDGLSSSEQLQNIQAALDAGVRWIQLRFKNADESQRFAVAVRAKAMCDSYQAQLIVNDHVALASRISASGVHLGLTDTAVADARLALQNQLIGGTANTLEDVLQRCDEACDYIGLGPLRFTATKAQLSPHLGLQGYRSITTSLKERRIETPIIAIGGIELRDLEALLSMGIHGLAISGLINRSADKKQLITTLNNILYGNV